MKLTASNTEYINATHLTTHFTIDVSLPITVLNGNSASGKSFFFKACEQTFSEIYKIIPVNYSDGVDIATYKIQSSKDAIIVFDRFDMFEQDTFSDAILTNKSNKYILMSRFPGHLYLSNAAYKTLTFKEPNIIYTSNIDSNTLQYLIQHQDVL